jgi:uncharacterized protein
MKAGIISDTHGYLHKGVTDFLRPCDEIWHCGDIGNMDVIRQLENITTVRAVSGNIDYGETLRAFPVYLSFKVEGLKVLMLHIGGYPGKYSLHAKQLIETEKPGLLACGHSHILKVMFDKKNELLFVNPGAAGKSGFHKFITALRFDISDGKPENLEIYEYLRSGF